MAKVLSPILQKGIGQPYMAIFNTNGRPIMNPITGIPIGAYISAWDFSYDEERENLANITIDTGDPDTVDIRELSENSILLLQWGYIYSNGEFISSPIRVIKVRDFNTTFDDKGTHITLVCQDGVSEFRYFPPYTYNESKEYSLSTLLDKGYYGNLGIIIEEFT